MHKVFVALAVVAHLVAGLLTLGMLFAAVISVFADGLAAGLAWLGGAIATGFVVTFIAGGFAALAALSAPKDDQ